jgi:hypothetical protein
VAADFSKGCISARLERSERPLFNEYNWLSYLLFPTPLAMIVVVGVSLLFATLAFYGTREAL